MREVRRVLLSRAHLGCLIFLLLLNSFLFLRQAKPDTTAYTLADYRENYLAMLAVCRGMDTAEAAAYVAEAALQAEAVLFVPRWLNTDDEEYREEARDYYYGKYGEELIAKIESGEIDTSERATAEATLTLAVCEQLTAQLTYLGEYPEYLQTIRDNAETMTRVSIFSDPDSFTYKNILKTVDDFANVDGESITLDNDLSLDALFTGKLADYSLLCYIVAVTLLLTAERKRGLWSLSYTAAGGRWRLALRRTGILLLCSAVGTAVLVGGRLLLAAAVYGGLGDVSRPIQSLALFRSVTESMTVGDFLLRYFLFKVLGTWLAALLVWLILLAVSNTSLAVAASALFLGVEYALFTAIPDSYTLVLFRFVNLFAFVDYQRVFMRYLNIDFFTLPIRGSSLTVILLPAALGLLGVGCILCHCRKKPVSTPNPLLRFYDRVLGIRDRLFHGRGLFRAELCKLLWHQRGAVILLLLLGWAIWLSSAPPIDWGSYDATAAYYRGQYEGPVSIETLSWIDEALSGMTVTVGDEAGALRYQSLLTVRGEAEELLARSEESGTELWLLNTTLYDALMNANINGYQRETGLTAVLFVVLLLAGSLAYENQQRVTKLLRCTKRGGGALWRRKAACALLLTTLVWLAVYGTEVLRAIDTYGGFHALRAPVQSLGPMTALPGSLSIGGWLAVMYLTRLLVLWLCAFAVLLVSGLCAGVNLAVVVCAAVFLLPGALGLMGSEVMESFSFTRPLSVAECVGSPLVFYLPCAAVGVGAYGAGRMLWLKRR